MADKRFFTEMAQSMASDSKNKNIVKTLGKVEPALTILFSKKSYVPLKDVKSEFDKLISAAKTNVEKDALMNCYDRGASYYHKYYLQVRAERNKIAKTFDATHAPAKSAKKTESKKKPAGKKKTVVKANSKPTDDKIKTPNITKHKETLNAQTKTLETAKAAATESK